jgi:hypothetical protein
VQLIYAEPCREDPRFFVITRGGATTGEDKVAQGKTTDDHRVRKATEMTTESGKLLRRPQCLILRKKDRYLRRQEKSSKEIKGLHQRNNQK